MNPTKPNILVISALFPNPTRPAFGIFVKKQCEYLKPYANQVVVVPYRVFPHLRLWQNLTRPHKMHLEWGKWLTELQQVPRCTEIEELPVYYPRYTSLPRQIFYSTWGYFAYATIRPLLRHLHQLHKFDLIHAHYASPAGVVALLAKRWMHVPVVLSVHGVDVTYTVKQNRLGAGIIQWTFRHTDAILANSSWTKQQIVRYGGNPQSVQIVRYGGNHDPALVLRKEEALPPTTSASGVESGKEHVVTLLSVGYLEERKGHAYVLHAMKRLRELEYSIRYVIVGDGTQKESLVAQARDLGLDDFVSFEGYKPHSEAWPYFANCDIFVLPSWNEAFGIVYIEALSLGKPPVGCMGEGGPEDLHALGDCIELVRPRDIESLVQALRGLLDDPERRRKMGEIGRKIVAEYFTWEKMAEHTAQTYTQLLRT
jgi:glycosyltransferase involved in cell wall biosynthesis